jgi:hypothetical protein
MTYCVEVSIKPGFVDARGLGLLRQVEALGVGGVESWRSPISISCRRLCRGWRAGPG